MTQCRGNNPNIPPQIPPRPLRTDAPLKPVEYSQSGNPKDWPKGRPKGRGLTDSLRRKMRECHNGKPMADILAEVMLKHALSGKYQHLKEIYDRVEARPVETVKADVNLKAQHFVVPPPRVLGESEDEYRARLALERTARDHQRMLNGPGDEGPD